MTDLPLFNQHPLCDPEDRQVVFAALDSFRQYRRHLHYNITHRRRQNLYALPSRQWQILAAPPFELLDTFSAVDDALDCNADLADAILECGLHSFGLQMDPGKGTPHDWHGAAKPDDMAKAHSTIRQFYRDWSEEGFTAEVEPLLKIILNDLAQILPLPLDGSAAPVLLLPGAGLGRLLFSLSVHGYHAEGNEISYHQLLASNFILNATGRAQQYPVYPFASTFTNHKSRANQLKSVLVPDIHPASIVSERKSQTNSGTAMIGVMNMTAGDFLTSYGGADSRDSFDCVISIYFIDTAPNLIRYIETVHNCLKEGGVWINIGPLLWHFDDRRTEGTQHKTNGDEAPALPYPNQPATDDGIGEPGSFELTDEEVLRLLQTMDFEIVKHDYVQADYGGYIQDSTSMVQNRYECSHWVAKKKMPASMA